MKLLLNKFGVLSSFNITTPEGTFNISFISLLISFHFIGNIFLVEKKKENEYLRMTKREIKSTNHDLEDHMDLVANGRINKSSFNYERKKRLPSKETRVLVRQNPNLGPVSNLP